jgi:hypothetical protein
MNAIAAPTMVESNDSSDTKRVINPLVVGKEDLRLMTSGILQQFGLHLRLSP